MNEDKLNEALHDVMVRSTPPPSMDPALTLERARRVRTQRRAVWGSGAAMALVVGIGVGPALVTNLPGDGSTGQVANGTNATVAPTTRKTNDPWPEGQDDRTASAGPRVERARQLVYDLESSLPRRVTAQDRTYPDGRPMRRHYAQYASADGEPAYWEYSAVTPVFKDGRIGRVIVKSFTPDGKSVTAPCKLVERFGFGTGRCTVMDVRGKKVGVVTNLTSDFDQVAIHRYADGTVVYLGQVKDGDRDNPQPLPLLEQVYTPRQLAEAVLNPKFKISS